ncbi:DivIVA domain-containing protein [Tsukamurella sp. 8F]|uniref:DivIVA domain-containing protein n=1 Tax=unclassified Tsukamurella TaxID=2633480 RepID=UPI0023B8BD60|nr:MULTISPECIES: DivIVA domain-containing protein [unclassified Tsukamurella]MDF0530042.1 DivIVA domain-containing protein [Tsukamurella sp. 8J]MDF0589546.1 DivIVA domain-containing protein [Tsukamurella sp. 8F]
MVILLYVLGMAVVVAVLYGVVVVAFGRGDDTPPLPADATPTVLPAEDITAADVRDLRFTQVVRGYKPAEVDWALERMALEIDTLRARLSVAHAGASAERTDVRPPESDEPGDIRE